MDNTLVMVFSDNGASAEGGKAGSFNEHRFTAHIRESVAENLAHYDDWGGFSTYNHYSWAWAWAGNTPHKLWKRYTWLGGTRTPLIVHWPGRIAQPGTVRPQFAHAIDLMPTILRAAGLEIPDEVDGVAQQPVDGVSLLSALEDPAAPELHHTQYFEMMGSRSIYHEGWKATTNHISTGILDEEELAVGSRNFDEDRWELFDLSSGLLRGDRPRRRRAGAAPTAARPVGRRGAAATTSCPSPTAWSTASRASSHRPGPPGSSRTFRPGGGAGRRRVGPAALGRLRHHGRHRHRPATGPTGSSSPWATGSAATPSTSSAGGPTSRSPGPPTRSSWRRPASLGAGHHEITVSYAVGDDGAPGRMVLLVDGAEVDETAVEGMLPLAVQHGGAGLRLGWDSGFPVSSRYTPPARFEGTVHGVRVDTPGSLPVRPGGRGARRAPRRLTRGRRAGLPQALPAAAARAWARCSRVWRAGTAARSAVGKTRPPAGPNGALRSSSSSLRARSERLEARPAVRREGRPSRRA